VDRELLVGEAHGLEVLEREARLDEVEQLVPAQLDPRQIVPCGLASRGQSTPTQARHGVTEPVTEQPHIAPSVQCLRHAGAERPRKESASGSPHGVRRCRRRATFTSLHVKWTERRPLAEKPASLSLRTSQPVCTE
jgi:hypothetical protein